MSHEWWFDSTIDNQAEVGAYVPADLEDGAAPVSVFWRGAVSREWLKEAVSVGEVTFRKFIGPAQTGVSAKLYAFGPTEEIIESDSRELSSLLSEGELSGFSAYRAEFHSVGSDGSREFSIWATVDGADDRSMGEGGENVGVSISADLFPGLAGWFIRRSIELTRQREGLVLDGLFEAVNTQLTAGLGRPPTIGFRNRDL